MPKQNRSEFFYVIGDSALRAIWPQHTVAVITYLLLTGLVTLEVADPEDPAKRIGIVLSGSMVTDEELANRVKCDLRQLRYGKKVLLELGLLIERRYQSCYRLAIRNSAKNCPHARLDGPQFEWLRDALSTAENRQKCLENNNGCDSENDNGCDSHTNHCDSHTNGCDSLSGLDQQNQSDASGDKKVDKRVYIVPPGTTDPQHKEKKNSCSAGNTNFSYIRDDFAPNDDNRALAATLGLDISQEVSAFRDHNKAQGGRSADWCCSFNGWLRRAAKLNRQRPSAPITGSLTENYQKQIERYQ